MRVVTGVMFESVSRAVLPAVSVARNCVADQSTDNRTTYDRRAVAVACKSTDHASSYCSGDGRASMGV